MEKPLLKSQQELIRFRQAQAPGLSLFLKPEPKKE